MKFLLPLALALTLFSSCGRGRKGHDGVAGATILGASAVSTGVDLVDIAPGMVCTAGGVNIYTFFDINSNGVLDSGENVIKVKSLCNGIDGADGTSSTLTMEGFASSSTCSTGGVKISSNSQDSFEICNGLNGINGEQGIQGEQGIPGIAGSDGAAGADGSNGSDGADGSDGMNGSDGADGADGTIVTPVKFCASDNSQFPEYGLLVGDDLFAVYWGTTPASPSVSQAFLAKLTPGQYRSTGGNNCIFLVE